MASNLQAEGYDPNNLLTIEKVKCKVQDLQRWFGEHNDKTRHSGDDVLETAEPPKIAEKYKDRWAKLAQILGKNPSTTSLKGGVDVMSTPFPRIRSVRATLSSTGNAFLMHVSCPNKSAST